MRQPVMSSAPQTLWHWLLKSDPITLPLAWLPARRTRTLKYNSVHYHKNFGKDRILKTQQFEARNNRALFQIWKKESWSFQKDFFLREFVKSPRQRNYTSHLSIQPTIAPHNSKATLSQLNNSLLSYHHIINFIHQICKQCRCRKTMQIPKWAAVGNWHGLKWSQSSSAPWMPSCVGGICQCLA